MWAGYLALVNQQLAANSQGPAGFINPTIYQQNVGSAYATDFHDITSGTSGSYSAVTGYDLVTGWGSPTPALVNALAGTQTQTPDFTIAANPGVADRDAGQQRKLDDLDLGDRWVLVGSGFVGVEHAFGCDGAVQSGVDQRIADLGGDVHRGRGNNGGNVLDHDYGNEREPVAFDERKPDGERNAVELHDLGLTGFAHGDARIVGQFDDHARGHRDGSGDVLGYGPGRRTNGDVLADFLVRSRNNDDEYHGWKERIENDEDNYGEGVGRGNLCHHNRKPHDSLNPPAFAKRERPGAKSSGPSCV